MTRSEECPDKGRLVSFMAAVKKAGVSERSAALFARRAALEPQMRLAVNLKGMLECMATKEIDSLLVDGVSQDERRALEEIQVRGLARQLLEVGHGLFDMHARGLLLRSFSRLFRKAQAAKVARLADTV